MLEKFRGTQERTSPVKPTGSAPVSKNDITCIGEAISIEGSISGKGNLVIQGKMKGKIDLTGHQFTVGRKGSVEADIQAEKVTISGAMKGNIASRGKVEITKTAEFEGEIKAKGISVEDGAYLKAVIELDRRPKVSPAVKPVAQAKPKVQMPGSLIGTK